MVKKKKKKQWSLAVEEEVVVGLEETMIPLTHKGGRNATIATLLTRFRSLKRKKFFFFLALLSYLFCSFPFSFFGFVSFASKNHKMGFCWFCDWLSKIPF